jgi:hypothetical protein
MSENEKKVRDIAEIYSVRTSDIISDWIVEGNLNYEDLYRIVNGMFEDALTDFLFYSMRKNNEV